VAEQLSDRFRPSGLAEALEQLALASRAAWRRTWAVLAVFALAALAGLVALEGATGEGVGFGVGLAALVIGGIATYGLVRRQRLTEQKLTFALGLCDRLADDFHPAGKIAVEVDLRPYDRAPNRYWSGRSLHGNAKYKYADRWLVLKFALADGSRVRLHRKADVKTKKGSVQRHKRQLYVRVAPNPERYGAGPWDLSVLDGLVQTAVARQFHDPPEELRVRARAAGASSIDLKITQLDAEILPDEVVALLDATLSAVHLHRLDPSA
jgi:hypothetical protein